MIDTAAARLERRPAQGVRDRDARGAQRARAAASTASRETEPETSVAASLVAQAEHPRTRRRPKRSPRPEALTMARLARCVPASTYRLQITEGFDLLEAAKTLAYLRELGVDWVYLSPLLSSESGSDHGYDVSDHSSIDPSRGRGVGTDGSRERGRAASAWACSSTSCRTTSGWRGRGRTSGGGTCSPTARTRRTPPRSTSTGTLGDGTAAHPGARRRRPPRGRHGSTT